VSSQRTERPTWQRPLVAALVSAALIPAFFLMGFAAAHIPYLVWPYEEGAGNEPLWFGAITQTIFMVILFIPIVAAVWFGMRVIRLGSWWGWLPIAVATAIGVYFLVLTGIAVAGRLLGGGGVI
jgi:hypothetical protein